MGGCVAQTPPGLQTASEIVHRAHRKLVLLKGVSRNKSDLLVVQVNAMPVRRFHKEDKEYLPPSSYIVREVEAETRQKELEVEERESRLLGKIEMTRRQERLFLILVIAFPVSVVFSLLIVLLDGYHWGGFDIETSTINLLVGATIAEIAGLLAVIISTRSKIKGK